MVDNPSSPYLTTTTTTTTNSPLQPLFYLFEKNGYQDELCTTSSPMKGQLAMAFAELARQIDNLDDNNVANPAGLKRVVSGRRWSCGGSGRNSSSRNSGGSSSSSSSSSS